jgi:hypothetical protein
MNCCRRWSACSSTLPERGTEGPAPAARSYNLILVARNHDRLTELANDLRINPVTIRMRGPLTRSRNSNVAQSETEKKSRSARK